MRTQALHWPQRSAMQRQDSSTLSSQVCGQKEHTAAARERTDHGGGPGAQPASVRERTDRGGGPGVQPAPARERTDHRGGPGAQPVSVLERTDCGGGPGAQPAPVRERTDRAGGPGAQPALSQHSPETCSRRPAGTARLSRGTQGCSLGWRWKGIRDGETRASTAQPCSESRPSQQHRVTSVPTAQDASEEGSEVLPTAEHGWTLHTNLEHEQKVPEAVDWHADGHTVWRW